MEYVTLDFSKSIIPELLQTLYARRIGSLIVEGGAVLLQSFIDAGYWDEIRIETAPVELNNGIPAPVIPFVSELIERHGEHCISVVRRR